MAAIALAFLVFASGCGKAIVAEPVATVPIAKPLMTLPRQPKCDPPDRDEYAPQELWARGDCWKDAYGSARAQLAGLQQAVRSREETIAKAVKAAN